MDLCEQLRTISNHFVTHHPNFPTSHQMYEQQHKTCFHRLSSSAKKDHRCPIRIRRGQSKQGRRRRVAVFHCSPTVTSPYLEAGTISYAFVTQLERYSRMQIASAPHDKRIKNSCFSTKCQKLNPNFMLNPLLITWPAVSVSLPLRHHPDQGLHRSGKHGKTSLRRHHQGLRRWCQVR